ncbi:MULTISPECIES: antibiotic biosynthesis monooxygenase family protein [Micromonospora]|uniref:antibiotic biosynthesis monooxygenase family protein n=1 Tax=Micromonospora TaxID=1873 RepID=UPI0033DD04F5
MTEKDQPAGRFFRILLRMVIRPEARDEFERTWLRVGSAVTDDPGNLAQWLLRSQDEDDVYYIVSDWIDEASFRRFENSPQHVEHRAHLHPYRVAGSMVTMESVYHLSNTATGAS